MNYGPLVFLGIFISLASSWFGMIFYPQVELGRQEVKEAEVSGGLYPAMRPGQARQGAEVYRSEGCYYCHTQQTRQEGVQFDVILNKVGANTNGVVEAVLKISPNWGKAAVEKLILISPQAVLSGVSLDEAERAEKILNEVPSPDDNNKAQAYKKIIPLGPDMDRGLGVRRSVAADYLFDSPVMLGEQRIGPDLSNVGLRLPDANWHLLHLYAPTAMPGAQKSVMPSFKYLFIERPVGSTPSPEALKLPPELAKPGMEVIPTNKAKELVAYLLSLKTTTPIFEAPMPPVIKKEEPATNKVATAAPAK